MTPEELVKALRSTESRSNRELLDSAADTIEALARDMEIIRTEMDGGCLTCATDDRDESVCEANDFACYTCGGCSCRECRNGSKWKWRGI